MERCCVGTGRAGGALVSVCDSIRRCYLCSIQYYEVVIAASSAVQIRYNDGCAFMFVEYMERCPVAWPWTNRMYAFIGVCLNSCSIQYYVVISTWRTVQIHYNDDNGCAVVFVDCMKRCCVFPGRTACTFVLMCVWIWKSTSAICGLDFTLMWCANALLQCR